MEIKKIKKYNIKVKPDMKKNVVHVMRSGNELKIVKYYNSLNVKVEFKETGYITCVSANEIRKGLVKDIYAPSVFNLGIIGEINNPYKHPLYQSWVNELRKLVKGKPINPNFIYFSYYIEHHEAA